MKEVTFAAVFFLLAFGATDAQVCANKATVSPTDPRIPQALPSTFQVTIAGTIMSGGPLKPRSIVAKEYMNSTAGRSAFYSTVNGVQEIIFINTGTNESYHIEGTNCTVENMAKDKLSFLDGGPTGSSGKVHAYSSAAMLRFAQQYGEIYMGQTTVRGIPVDHWQSCMYWSSLMANFTLDYYFTLSNWTTQNGMTQIPVRAEVKGYSYTYLRPFHHIYDYIEFKNTLDDPTKLETPSGIVCPGRKNTRSAPSIANDMRFRLEMKNIAGHVISNADVWYSHTFKLVRYDSRPLTLKFPTFSNDPTREVHDYMTGVAYVIDTVRYNCTMTAIENNTLDAVTISGVEEKMKNPIQLFQMQGQYSYSGQRYARNILCDVFSSFVPISSNGISSQLVYEIYFMAKSWISYNDDGSNAKATDVPVRVNIIDSNLLTYMQIEIYNFDADMLFFNLFDVSLCFPDSSVTRWEITFPGNYADFLKAYRVIVADTAMEPIFKYTGIQTLRLQGLYIHWDQQNAYLVGSFLGPPPILARFHHWKNKVADFTDNGSVKISSPTLCAAACEIQVNATCNSFDVCPQVGTCSLSLNYTTDGRILKNSKTCDHYSRVVTGKVMAEVDNNVAYALLQQRVNAGKFLITVSNPKTNQQVVFKATSVKTLTYAGEANAHTCTQFCNSTVKSAPQTSSQAGAIVGAAFGMLILGILIGIGAVILFNKRRTLPDLQVSYSNASYKE